MHPIYGTIIYFILIISSQPGTPRYPQVKSRIFRQGLLHLFQQDTQATLLASQGSLDAIPSTLDEWQKSCHSLMLRLVYQVDGWYTRNG